MVLERLSAKEWEQADGLLKKAEAAVEKLKKERERERERERRERVCVRVREVQSHEIRFFYSVSCTSIMKDATKLTEKIKDDPLTLELPLGSFFLL